MQLPLWPVWPIVIASASAAAAVAVGFIRERRYPHSRKREVYFRALLVVMVFTLTLISGIWGKQIDERSVIIAQTPGAISMQDEPHTWGPPREIFTMEEPAYSPTLNSITNHPSHGDERNFVQVRQLGAEGQKFANRAEICPGDTAEFYIFVANDAAARLGESGTIRGLRLNGMAAQSSSETTTTMLLSATNAGSVWSSVEISCAGRSVDMRFLKGTLLAHFDKNQSARVVDGNPFAAAVPIGRDRDDGTIPCVDGWFGYLKFQAEIF